MKKFRRLLLTVTNLRSLRQQRRPVRNQVSVSARLARAWQSPNVPEQQWRVVQPQLEKLSRGNMIPEFAVFQAGLETSGLDGDGPCELLEIVCSSGYYSQVLAQERPNWRYSGVDFSEEFIVFGKKMFPSVNLQVGDARDLPFQNKAFDIVVSGCVLLHIFEWKLAIAESARVASKYLLLHRTPVAFDQTKMFTKVAYGQKMIEWTFNESEIIENFGRVGFQCVKDWFVYDETILSKKSTRPAQKTYLMRRNDG